MIAAGIAARVSIAGWQPLASCGGPSSCSARGEAIDVAAAPLPGTSGPGTGAALRCAMGVAGPYRLASTGVMVPTAVAVVATTRLVHSWGCPSRGGRLACGGIATPHAHTAIVTARRPPLSTLCEPGTLREHHGIAKRGQSCVHQRRSADSQQDGSSLRGARLLRLPARQPQACR